MPASNLDDPLVANKVTELIQQGVPNTSIAKTISGEFTQVSEAAIRRFRKRYGLVQSESLELPKRDIRALCLDIETKPALAYVWGLFNINIGLEQLVHPSEMICWAAKWLDFPEIEFRSTYHDGKETMINRMWQLLDEADVIIHYNGQRFDVRHLNREFVENDLRPPAPYQQIDLLKTARRHFQFQSNKLAHVSVELGLEGKTEHEGFGLWLKCMQNDPDAWGRMRQYNIQDINLLEDLYNKLRPWIPGHPSHAAFSGANVCPKCGSDHIEYRGQIVLRTARYHRIHCLDCGAWSRETKRMDSVQVTEASL